MSTASPYELTKPKPDQITFRLKGEVDADAMRKLLPEFFTLAEDMSDAKLLYIAEVAEVPSFAALGVELTQLPKVMSVASNFSRCAVVADEGWLRAVSEMQGKLSPGMTLKTFERHETSVAQTWLDAPTN